MSYGDALKKLEDAVAKLDDAVERLEDAQSALTSDPYTRKAYLDVKRAGRAARRMMQSAPHMDFDDALKEVNDAGNKLEDLIAVLEDVESTLADGAAAQQAIQNAKSAGLDAAAIVENVRRVLLDIERESNEIRARLSGHSAYVVDDDYD